MVSPASSIASDSNFKTTLQSGECIPPDHGTASIAEYEFDTAVDGIKENVAEGLLKSEECEIETMLQAMLRIIAQKTNDSTENEQWAEEALQKCLDAASNFLQQSDNGHRIDLLLGIRAYCDATKEEGRYTGTTSALNAIICHFRSDFGQQALPAELRVPEQELSTMFEMSYNRIINPDPPRASNNRKPDIVQLEWTTARTLNGDINLYDGFEATVRLANTKPPEKQKFGKLRWSDILMAFELKRNKDLREKVIPTEFGNPLRLTKKNTVCPLKAPKSGLEDDTPSTPSPVDTIPPTKKATEKVSREMFTSSRKTRSMSTNLPSPITASSSVLAFPTTASASSASPASPVSPAFPTSSATPASPASRTFPSFSASPAIASSSAMEFASPETSSAATGLSTQMYSNGSRKRKASQVAYENPNSKKIRKSPKALHPVVQSAIYAAERLSTGAWVKCTIGIVLSDNMLYLVIYDRQSPLAARGFDFINNLPHFVVLGLILQRLQSCHWDTLACPPTPEVQFTLEKEEEQKKQLATITIKGRKFQFNPADASTFYVLNGRGTTGVPVTEVKEVGTQETKDRLFLKMSWPETIRQRESDVIKQIKEVIKEYPQIELHTPDLEVSATLTAHSTSNIRRLLRLKSADKDRSRVLCCMVFERLSPITELEGMKFWKAYWEIIETHRILWSKGIKHCDISLSNLMYRMHDGTPKGVLNDYDLARLCTSGGRQGNCANDRTGTIPFMAIDLLSPEAQKGLVPHLYRHDLESFAWVLFWVLTFYDEGKAVSPVPRFFEDWTVSAESAYDRKFTFLFRAEWQPQQSWKWLGSAGITTRVFWRQFYNKKEEINSLEKMEQGISMLENAEQDTTSLGRDKDDQDDMVAAKGEQDDIQLLQELFAFLKTTYKGRGPGEEVLQNLPCLRDTCSRSSRSHSFLSCPLL